MEWKCVKDELASSTRQRLHGLESLSAGQEQLLSNADQMLEFLDLVPSLLQDNNYKVAQQTLHILSTFVSKEEYVKPYISTILPLVAERLADTQQLVRDECCNVLLIVFSTMPASWVLEKLSRFWSHRHWKVRQGMLHVTSDAIARGVQDLFATSARKDYLITQVVNLLEDPNEKVRDAALNCLREMYCMLGAPLLDDLRSQNLRPSSIRALVPRLEEVADANCPIPDLLSPTSDFDILSSPGALGAVLTRRISRRGSCDGADPNATIILNSKEELLAEFQAASKVLDSLAADWQVRVAAMARIEAIVGSNQALLEFIVESFKLLIGPFNVQLEDRRSAVSRRACLTLSAVAEVMGPCFEEYMLQALPVLFRVLPITIQIMAESSSECVRLLLQRCHAPGVVALLVEAATKDKNFKIRGMCAHYLVQVMETWEPSVYESYRGDLEKAITFSAGDTSADARSAAREMYTAYERTSPERAEAMLLRLEPRVRERLKNSKGRAATARPALASRRGPRPIRPATACHGVMGWMFVAPSAGTPKEMQEQSLEQLQHRLQEEQQHQQEQDAGTLEEHQQEQDAGTLEEHQQERDAAGVTASHTAESKSASSLPASKSFQSYGDHMPSKDTLLTRPPVPPGMYASGGTTGGVCSTVEQGKDRELGTWVGAGTGKNGKVSGANIHLQSYPLHDIRTSIEEGPEPLSVIPTYVEETF